MKEMPTIYESALALYDFSIIMESLHIPFMLDGGTLLGFYRDQKFCEDDQDDIDTTVHSDFWVRGEEIHRAMLERGFMLYHMWPRNTEKRQSGQYAWKRGNVKIDLMFKEIKGDRAWWTVYGGKNRVTYKAVPACYVLNTSCMEISLPISEQVTITKDVRVPVGCDEYFEIRYGNWQTPVHRSDYSCYTSDRCIVEPNSYEAI